MYMRFWFLPCLNLIVFWSRVCFQCFLNGKPFYIDKTSFGNACMRKFSDFTFTIFPFCDTNPLFLDSEARDGGIFDLYKLILLH